MRKKELEQRCSDLEERLDRLVKVLRDRRLINPASAMYYGGFIRDFSIKPLALSLSGVCEVTDLILSYLGLEVGEKEATEAKTVLKPVKKKTVKK